MFKIKTQNNTFHFYYFNPLKSTQIGSNADRTDDFPPPKNPCCISYKTYMTEKSITLAGRGATTVLNITTQ